jgi:ATP-dependent protease ClpP protease subunit
VCGRAGQALCTAARAHHDASAIGRAWGGRPRTSRSRHSSRLHIKKVLLRAHLRAHRPVARPGGADADRDRWFTAAQAKEYGFIDHVITSAREAADKGALPTRRTEHELLHPAVGGAHLLRHPSDRPYAKLFEERIIFLGTPISDDIANAVMAQLLCLESMDPERVTSRSTSTPRVARSPR